MSEVLEIRDFSGGIADYPLNSALNKAEVADNLLIEQQGGVSRYVLRPGSDYASTSAPQIPEGAQRIASLYMLGAHLLVHTSQKLYAFAANSLTATFQDTALYGGPFFGSDANRVTSATKFTDGGIIICSDIDGGYNSHPVLVYSTGTIPKSQSAGLPAPALPSGSSSTAGANNWLYKFVYKHDFVITTSYSTNYTMLSEPVLHTTLFSSVATVTFTGMPSAYVNTSGFFPTTYEIEVYRTLHNGTVFYYEGSVFHPTTTFVSLMPDSTLQTRKRLYTEGGVQPNTKPPRARSVHTNGELTYYAGVTHDANDFDVSSGTIYQSKPGIPWAVPTSFYTVVDDRVKCVSSVSGTTLALCKSSVYRIEGSFDSFGRGGMSPQRISDTASCVSAQSVVQTEDGLYWAGTNGIFYSDGYKVKRINEDYDKSWSNLVKKTEQGDRLDRIQGKYDTKTKRVFWTLQKLDSNDTELIYILDTAAGISKTSSFTTMSGGYNTELVGPFNTPISDYFSATSLEFYQEYSVDGASGAMFRGDKNGILHRHPLINSVPQFTSDRAYTGIALASEPYIGVYYTYQSPSFNFDSTTARKWVPRMNLNLDYTKASTSSIQTDLNITSINDAGGVETALDKVSHAVTNPTNSPNYSFASKWRHFPRTSLRCVYKQIRMTPAAVTLSSSTPSTLATVSGTTVTIAGAGVGSNVTLYSRIYFASDGYTLGHRIISINAGGTVITMQDSLTLGGPGQSWLIKGVSKNVIFPILSYAIHFTTLRDSNKAFASSEAQV